MNSLIAPNGLKRNNMTRKILIILTLFLFNLGYGQTNTWTGTTSTAWETGSNWSLGIVPTAVHDVVIPNVTTKPIISVAGAVCASLIVSNVLAGSNSLTINLPGTLAVTGTASISAAVTDTSNSTINVTSGTLTAGAVEMNNPANDTRHCSLRIGTGIVTITGDITMSTSAARNDVTFSGAGILNIGTTISGGTLTAGTGLVNYNSLLAQTVGTYVYNNLTVSGSGIKTIAGITVNGIFSMEGDINMSVSAQPTYGPNATLQYNSTSAQKVGLEWPNNTVGSFTSSGGVIISNTGVVSIDDPAGAVFKILTENVPLIINNGASLYIVLSSTLNLGGNYINNGGTLTTNGSINIVDAMPSQSFGAVSLIGANSFVRVGKTSGTVTLTGNINGGTLIMTSATLNLGIGLTHTIPNDWRRQGGTIEGGSSILKIGGNIIGTGGSFIPNTGTVEFNGPNQSLLGAITYNNLVLSGSGTKTFGGATTITNTFSIAAGAVADLTAGLSHTAGTLSLGGTNQVSGSWGSTSSAPLHTNDTFFAANTGVVNVGAAIATLANLTISSGTLTPVFAAGTTSYTASVDNAVASITVTPTTTDVNATVTVNGVAVTSGNASGAIALVVGANTITTIVTAQNGVTTATYTIIVTREVPVAPGGVLGEAIWYKANSGITLNAANVSQWNDFSANANNAIQGTAVTQPAYTTNSINFNQAVTFSGTNFLTAPINNLPSGNSARSLFVVAASANTQTANSWVYGYGASNAAQAYNMGKIVNVRPIYLSTFNSGSQSSADFWITNIPKLGTVTYNASVASFFDAGTPIGTPGIGALNTVLAANSARIGNFSNSSVEQWRGNIAEIILYPSLVTGNAAISVESYLAIKYGIHKTGNYLSGSGSVIWDATANTAYHNDVFGIAQDNLSGLLQPQSNSSNTGSGNGTGQSAKGNIILSNASSLVNNGFLMIGHDTNALTEINAMVGVNFIKRVQRTWKVQSTGNPGSITLSYDVTGLTYSAQSFNDYVLLVDPTGTGDFSSGSVVQYPAASLANNKVSFNAVTLPTGAIFTFQTFAVSAVQATNIAFTNTAQTTTTASWTNGNGTSRAVFMFAGATGSPIPVNNTTYTANTAFGLGTQVGTTGWYCVYNGTGTTVNITGLTARTTYQVMTVEYNGSVGNELYLSTISTGNPAGVTTTGLLLLYVTT
jgi:hypothetical protein